MAMSLNYYINKLILSLLVFAGFTASLFSQTTINGTINEYGNVTSIGVDFVVVDDLTRFNQFAAGDTVLLIQMKGVGISVREDDGSYGYLQYTLGEPGKYEFLLIQSVVPGTKTIIFRNDILNTSFDVDGVLQIVKVPSYNSAVVDVPDLTCAPWDSTSKTGGVLTMIVGRTLSLNSNIDVTGKGFIGGAISIGTGICVGLDGVNLDKYAYDSSYTNSGFKGENQVVRGYLLPGPVYPTIYPGYSKGKGANFNGGGGGSGRFSGGGGGSNYGAGGRGGREQTICTPTPNPGGIGGYEMRPELDRGIFLGGGAGSSTYLAGSIPSPGGNGGGIVIIVCDTIIGNGNSIIADGATTTEASIDAGSGGGGGGGSIALYLSSFSDKNITISANGGKGGNNAGAFGQGGGGGGGLINIKSMAIPFNVTRTVDRGEPGIKTAPPTSTTAVFGFVGKSYTDFLVVLNGFLFNSIRSSVTGDQGDSICSNMLPKMITGTNPAGGTTPYTYLWEKSYDANFTVPIPLVNDVDPTNYTPTVIETDTVWFRRTITDSSVPIPLIDVSKPVKIIVQPFIKNNIVGTSDTICFAQDPPAFSSKATITDGNGIFTYEWEVSTDESLYNLPLNTYNTEGYTPPPALELTSWYRRKVTSGRCIDSTTIVKITVLDTISNNTILNLPQDICYGMVFTDITATTSPALSGGDNSYWFKWESSTDASTWVTATGTSDGAGYDPDELSLSFPGSEYYRRVVYSGSNDVCVNFSTPILLNDYPVLTNNSITDNQTICSGAVPAILAGSDPLNGNGTYTYIWRDSTKAHTWTDISGATARDYQPSSLTDTTWYRRVVYSSACSDISNSLVVNVHKPILNNIISLFEGGLVDTTICNGAVPNMFTGTSASGGTDIPGDYVYQWYFTTDNITWNPVDAAGTGVNFQSPALSVTTYFRRQVMSGFCTVISGATITVNVLPLITNNVISDNQTICYNATPTLLTGATLSGGDGSYRFFWEQSTDGTIWDPAEGANNLTSGSYQPPPLNISMKYKCTVKSGDYDCCESVSNIIDIEIHPLPSSQINAGSDTMIYSIEKIFHMRADPVLTGEEGLWTVLDPMTSTIEDKYISDYQAEVRNLSKGENLFLWTISNGLCKLEDSVSIELLEDFIPQGFSPNGDEWNDTFIIEGLDLWDQDVSLSVLSGTGKEVFSTSSPDWKDWDGKNSRGIDLPEGTYYYLLKISKENKLIFKKSGFIVLKRY